MTWRSYQVSPADETGHHSLGLAGDYVRAAVRTARVVMAEVNDQVPFTYGELLPGADIDVAVPVSRPPVEVPAGPPGPVDEDIARHAAAYVEDGSVLQIGIGAVPEAITRRLRDRRDLGVHSGMLGDGLVDLVESGAVTNARKPIDRGVSVTGLLIGTQRLFGFAHRNDALALRDGGYISDPAVLARLDRLVTINSALEVDLGRPGQRRAERPVLPGRHRRPGRLRPGRGSLPRRPRHHRAARHGPGRHDQPDHGPAVRPGHHGADRGGRDRDRVRRGRAEGAAAG